MRAWFVDLSHVCFALLWSLDCRDLRLRVAEDGVDSGFAD